MACARTKIEAIINNVLAPNSVAMVVQDLNEIFGLGVSTDSRNHGPLELFPIVIQYSHKFNGIKLKLIDLNSTLNEKSEIILKTERPWPPYKVCCILW
jgi:hypothetical protein